MSKVVPLNGFGGSGGNILNFKIVGGTTQPANPTENMIWVNTDQEITDWTFSVDEPENPVEGMIWIQTGTSKAVKFNSLKQHNLQVYPILTKQYIQNIWNNKVSKIYQDNQWIEWIQYIYYLGEQFTNITDGWVTTMNSNGNVVYNDNNITITVTKNTTSSSSTVCSTNKPIDLTDYSKLTVNIIDNNSTAGYGLTLFVSKNKVTTYEGHHATTARAAAETIGENTLDISGLTGEYYIGLYTGWTNPFTATLNQIKLWN